MDLLKCTVRLSGQLTHTVQRGVRGEFFENGKKDGKKLNDYATPAEIVILRALHGADAVPDNLIEQVGEDRRAHAAERDRLKMIYGDRVVDQVFPGFNVKLPVKLEDIRGEPVPTIILDNEVGTGAMLT